MFTVKFYKFNKEGQEISTVIACPNYSVYNRNNGHITITTYPTMFNENGVERNVVSSEYKITPDQYDRYFNVCFVENEKGKTIEHIKQPELPKEQASS